MASVNLCKDKKFHKQNDRNTPKEKPDRNLAISGPAFQKNYEDNC